MRLDVKSGLAAIAAISLMSVAAGAAERISIASGPLGGTWAPLGTAIAKIVSSEVKGVEATAEITEGSIQNARLVGGKKADMGLIAPDFAYDAYKGGGRFKEAKYDDLRAMFATIPTVLHIIASKESGVKALADIKGKRLAFSQPGSGGAAQSDLLLAVAGLKGTPKSIDRLNGPEEFAALADGKVDVVFYGSGMFGAAVQEYVTSHQGKYRFVSVSEDLIQKMNKDQPFYAPIRIPAGTYPGQEEDAVSFGPRALVTTNAKVPDAVVYEVTKAVFNNLKALGEASAAFKSISVEAALDSIAIPLHPGARKFWEEKKHPKVAGLPK